ncbi:MAG: DUF4035 domain-containing protein [Chloroflexi bacterium]|nr:DUF4035 domain-containing protein [Chloroflexota bacterium]
MSSREFSEWMAYYNLEPFGEERADLRMAMLASLIANVNRDPRKHSKPFEPKDFMPKFGEETHQTPEEQLAFVEMLNEAFGGRDLRPGKSTESTESTESSEP